MSSSREEVVTFGTNVGYNIPESDVNDYVVLLGKAKAAFEAVEAMDGENWCR
jgi:amidase